MEIGVENKGIGRSVKTVCNDMLRMVDAVEPVNRAAVKFIFIRQGRIIKTHVDPGTVKRCVELFYLLEYFMFLCLSEKSCTGKGVCRFPLHPLQRSNHPCLRVVLGRVQGESRPEIRRHGIRQPPAVPVR